MDWYLVALVVVWVLIVWAIVCNEWTYRDKMKLINEVVECARQMNESGDFLDWIDEWEVRTGASYGKHFWHRFTFRNPMRLYKL